MKVIAKKGDKGFVVKEVQEWLTFHKFNLEIDEKFGSITERVIKTFQLAKNLKASGIVDLETWQSLIEPITNACKFISNTSSNIGSAVISYAWQHLINDSKEIGGNNRGPWVRLYTGGKDGEGWLWCSWFVTYIIKEVCKQLSLEMPVRRTGSCDNLMNNAIKNKRKIIASDVQNGDLFLIKKSKNDWTHVGIVENINFLEGWFRTIEGNSNIAGNRDGDGVVSKTRAITNNIDFIKID